MNIIKKYNSDISNFKIRGRLLNYAAPVYDFFMQKIFFDINNKKILEQLNKLTIEEDFKILDVGCATGAILKKQIARLNKNSFAVGIDGAFNMIKIASKKNKICNLHFICADAAYLPFKNGYFDIIINTMFLHHLPIDCKIMALKEMKRVLKKGGIIFTVDIDKPTNFAVKIFLYLSALILFQKEIKENIDYGLIEIMKSAGITNNAILTQYCGSVSVIKSVA